MNFEINLQLTFWGHGSSQSYSERKGFRITDITGILTEFSVGLHLWAE